MKKIILLALLCAIILPLAQGQKRHHKKDLSPEAKVELKTHFQNNVLPVMNEALQKFDAQLSKEDLAFIQAKRKEIRILKASRKAKREKMKALRNADTDREKMKESMKAERKEERAAMREFHESMKPFMERNKTLIEASMENLQPQHEQWRADKKAIFEKYKPEGAKKDKACTPGDKADCDEKKGAKGAEMGEGHEGRRHHRKGRRGGHRGHHGMYGKGKKHAMHFVLWDGKGMDEDALLRDTKNAEELLPGLDQNYPNPATNFTTIEFELPKDAQQVRISIADINGKEVKYLDLGARSAGTHQQKVDVSNLQSGNYFYTINTDGVKATKKMVITQ